MIRIKTWVKFHPFWATVLFTVALGLTLGSLGYLTTSRFLGQLVALAIFIRGLLWVIHKLR